MASVQRVNCVCSIARALGIIEGIAMGLPDDYGGRRLEAAVTTIEMRLTDILDEFDDCSTSNAAVQPEV